MRFSLPLKNGLTKQTFWISQNVLLPLFLRAMLIFLFSFIACYPSLSQTNAPPDYEVVVRERSSKILALISFSDSVQKNKVLELMVQQYKQVNALHEAIPQDSLRNLELRKQHAVFLNQLQEIMTMAQIDQVKDGMTYRVFPITMAAYEDMLPNLTPEQKTKIYEWLKEARELAMDEGSSNKKHAMFGKYKGRINNYLSAQGYDMKKESRDWEERVKQRKEKEKNNNHQ